jgi:hypothetical protein
MIGIAMANNANKNSGYANFIKDQKYEKYVVSY